MSLYFGAAVLYGGFYQLCIVKRQQFGPSQMGIVQKGGGGVLGMLVVFLKKGAQAARRWRGICPPREREHSYTVWPSFSAVCTGL